MPPPSQEKKARHAKYPYTFFGVGRKKKWEKQNKINKIFSQY